MRIISEFETQFKIGQKSISSIPLQNKCRDGVTKFLLGIQYISANDEVMRAIFKLLQETIEPKRRGRTGMSLWKILILSLLRQIINGDYDSLTNFANNHMDVRAFLGHGTMDKKDNYVLQTIKDNVSLLTDEVLNKINTIVVTAGYKLLDARLVAKLNIKTDSFVVKSNVHFPTDANLLFDAMRYIVNIISKIYSEHEIKGWRQGKYQVRKIKTLMKKASKLKRSSSKNEEAKEKKEALIENAYIEYIEICKDLVGKCQESVEFLKKGGLITDGKLKAVLEFIVHAERQMDQLYRRIILKEVIPHSEKLFSLFEPYTEWVSKGKAGVPLELGLKVAVSSDQNGFILGHKVMQNQQDVDVATSMIESLQKDFLNIYSTSFDKGYYSPSNKDELEKKVAKVILPKKGKLSKKEKELIDSDLEYKVLRKKHSSVESDINALECHGLDRCPDRGIDNFKKYVSLSILAHNVHKIGASVQKKNAKLLYLRRKSLRMAA